MNALQNPLALIGRILLALVFVQAGFGKIYCVADNLEVTAWAFKGTPSAETRALFNLAA